MRRSKKPHDWDDDTKLAARTMIKVLTDMGSPVPDSLKKIVGETK